MQSQCRLEGEALGFQGDHRPLAGGGLGRRDRPQKIWPGVTHLHFHPWAEECQDPFTQMPEIPFTQRLSHKLQKSLDGSCQLPLWNSFQIATRWTLQLCAPKPRGELIGANLAQAPTHLWKRYLGAWHEFQKQVVCDAFVKAKQFCNCNLKLYVAARAAYNF